MFAMDRLPADLFFTPNVGFRTWSTVLLRVQYQCGMGHIRWSTTTTANPSRPHGRVMGINRALLGCGPPKAS